MLLLSTVRVALFAVGFTIGDSVPLPCPSNTTAQDVLGCFNLSGKVAIVTGGDAGLGYASAKALASQGAIVIIANHNATNGEQAAREIATATGAAVHARVLNLGSLASVTTFAQEFLAEFGPKLHLLINNAGITGPSKMTADGFELVFQIDYLGHFLLTELLLPALRESSPSRIVNVASGAHEQACEQAGWTEGCFKDWTYLPPPVVPVKNVTVNYKAGAFVVKSSSYGIAKFLNIQHAAALAIREQAHGIEAFSLTPGFALTGMSKDDFDPNNAMVKAFCKTQMHPDPSIPANPCPFSAEQGAAVIAFCASGDARSGAYFSRNLACEESPITMHGFTEAMQLELYQRSLQWSGLKLAESSTQYV